MAIQEIGLTLVCLLAVPAQAPDDPNVDAVVAAVNRCGGATKVDAIGGRRVVAVSLSVTNVTDDVLVEIVRQAPSIRKLTLKSTKISDAGAKSFSQLLELERLVIGNTQITNEGIVNLAGSKTLKYLDLSGLTISDGALKYLAAQPVLENLDLSRTRVTHEGLRHLNTLKNLRELSLQGCAIDDRSVEAIAEAGALEKLVLTDTQVTDRCIDVLAKMKSLRIVGVMGTHVTIAGGKRLQALCPTLSVVSPK